MLLSFWHNFGTCIPEKILFLGSELLLLFDDVFCVTPLGDGEGICVSHGACGKNGRTLLRTLLFIETGSGDLSQSN